MKALTANELRALFIRFFEEKGHAVIPSASVIPENDPTVLFTTAGMHPLVPYLMGQPHPAGKRLVNVQKCIRTGDIDDVGDDSHLTFFEMLGNWSLGDYFKEKMIPWSWEFLTSPEWLGIDEDRLAFSVFEGDETAPRDTESYELWRACGVPAERIFFLPRENNWWGPAGLTGPCGPDSEMFFISDSQPACGPDCSPACDCGHYLEIWNDVFMQYNKLADGSYEPLQQMNVDTGMGLERTVCVLMGRKSVYETELFSGIIAHIERLSGQSYQGADEDTLKAFRVVADHMRTATFILGDPSGVSPSNVDQGYVLRRLIRRAVRFGKQLGLQDGFTAELAQTIIDQYKGPYPELEHNRAFVLEQLLLEEERFQRTLQQGLREFEKALSRIEQVNGIITDMQQKLKETLFTPEAVERMGRAYELAKNVRSGLKRPELLQMAEKIEKFGEALKTIESFRQEASSFLNSLKVIQGRDAFRLYDTYGFPLEITIELAREKGMEVDEDDFHERFRQHQLKSQSGADQRFKGGLADHDEETTKLHTATHLLHAALRQVLGEDVHQKGSNITAERLRFDFTFGRRMTPEEIAQVQRLVNEAIAAKAPVTMEEMSVDEAKAAGAIGLFDSKYGDRVNVYTVEGFSKEICGGPHVKNTAELQGFRILKEESSSAGVRRIRAVVGPQEQGA